MPRFLTLLLLAALNFSSLTTNAQKQSDPNQSLLWRISGNGLSKPSYLFGTIHLTDKRLFRHDDSVFAAIDRAEGLAIELNPSELAAYYLNKMLDETDDDKKLEDMMSDEELKKYEEFFKKRFGKTSRNMTTKDLIKEKNKWVSQYVKKGAMPTILDAYLYTIADRHGKWVGGIEDVQDQMQLADRSDIRLMAASEKFSDIEQLINLYINYDLKGINEAINNYDDNFKDVMLTRRNIKMARRMDSLSQFRTMFFAVGAAHLPGDSGVINLLRARGFSVEPVRSANKIDADKYKFSSESKERWVEVTGERNLYTVQMPGIPTLLKLYGLMDMQYLIDFSDLTGYMSMVVTSASNLDNLEESAEKYAQRVFGRENVKKSRITNNGANGYEMMEEHDGNWLRIQLYGMGRILYIVGASAATKDKVKSEKSNKFFASYQVKPEEKGEERLYVMADSSLAYKFTSPALVSFNERLTKQTDVHADWRIRIYSGLDEATGSYVMLTSRDVNHGYYIPDDTVVLNDIFAGLSAQCEGTRKDTLIHGHKAMIFTCINSENIAMKMLSIVRGNRSMNFGLVTSVDMKDDERLNTMFHTLELLPYKQADWQVRSDAANTFRTYAPAVIVTESSEDVAEEGLTRFHSFDSLSATTYQVVIEPQHKYTWVENDSAFLKEKQDEYIEKDKVLLSQKVTRQPNELTREVVFKEPASGIYRRMKTLYTNNTLYHLFSSTEKSITENANTNRFFSDFKPTASVSFDARSSKTEQLLKDLFSKDSTTASEAMDALPKAHFSAKDIPALNALLLDTLPGMSDVHRYVATNAIKAQLKKVADTANISFVRNNYQKASGNKQVQYNLLGLLASIQTPEAYKTLYQLMAKEPLDRDYVLGLRFQLVDSLPLSAACYPEIEALARDTQTASMAAYISLQLLDSGLITFQQLKRNEETYIACIDKINGDAAASDRLGWGDYPLIELLDTLNTPAATNALKGFLTQNVYMRSKVAQLLAKKGSEVEPRVWQSIADTIITRSDLYNSLKEMNKEQLFPKQYANQKSLAESDIHVAANDEYEPSSVEYIGEKSASVSGTKYKFYLYRIVYTGDDESSSYLGIAGGYDTHGKQLSAQKDYTGLYWEEEYSKEKQDELFNAFINQLEVNEFRKLLAD
ncbi:MAG: TraB/GumN family protein [Flavipsychrobacter sp.]|nr:TraB/GumN family protein [Flavipsychrobacter sp.]